MMYEYWLAAIKPLSDRKKRLLREYTGSGKALYYIEETSLFFLDFLNENDVQTIKEAKKRTDLEESYQKLDRLGISFIPYFDSRYPKRLENIPSAPYALYVKGKLPEEEKLTAAIVGARRCTHYGERMALEYGEMLADAGVQIISGMAKGIDGAGHRGALNVKGTTFAVLGCGVDICYPREHIGLYEDMRKNGGLISEQIPGQPPLASFFPARNRIISGLADVVLVMEARERSGSLITADMALEQGRDVYALPGPATSSLSRGCHGLIRQGAGILISPEELLEELGIGARCCCQKTDKIEKTLESPENMVYSKLDLYPKSVDSLVRETGLMPNVLMSHLTALVLEGKIKEVSKNYYVRTR